jgi:hypothetical protein
MGGDDQHCEGAGADEAGIGESFDLGCGLAAQVNIAQEYRSAPACTTICVVEFTQQNSGRCRMRVSMGLTERVRAAYLSGAAHGPRAFTATAWAVRGECC